MISSTGQSGGKYAIVFMPTGHLSLVILPAREHSLSQVLTLS